MRYLVLAALLLAALLLAAGCTTTPPANATATPARTTASPNGTAVPPGAYTMHDSGETVPLGLQQTLSIRLPENPTTGYAWNASVTDGLQIVDTAYRPEAVGTGVVGAGGSRNWTVRGVEAGTQRFDAVYVRPWEPNVTADRFNLTVQVG
jgi:inhibitor of cysteine peptidase